MKEGLVIELQRLAVEQDCNILDLLSRSYVVSRKLNLDSFRDWIEHEQKGYLRRDQVPSYRKVATYLHYNNPYNGWQPVILSSRMEQDLYAAFPISDPISSINELLKYNEPFSITYLSDEMNYKYSNSIKQLENLGVVFQFALFTPRNAMRNIIEQVRNNILDWSLLLEEKGIIGDGMSFSSDELEKAKRDEIHNYAINFYGTAVNTQIQQSSNQSRQQLL